MQMQIFFKENSRYALPSNLYWQSNNTEYTFFISTKQNLFPHQPAKVIICSPKISTYSSIHFRASNEIRMHAIQMRALMQNCQMFLP